MPHNRVSLLTPPGVAALATIRIAGPAVGAFLAQHFSKTVSAGRCVHGQFRDSDRTIDDPVVVLVSPECADITLHGGSWVVQSAIELAKSAGFAWSDESSTGSDAENLLQAEVLEYLPAARTELALHLLLAQPSAWEKLIAESQSGSDMRSVFEAVLADRALDALLRLPRVAVVGIPNAGKSTLANQLFAQERAITADQPGTTRDWIGEIANLNGLAVLLVDTPGIRQTTDAIEAAAIAGSARQIESADLIVLVLDATQPLQPQQELIDRFPAVPSFPDIPGKDRERPPSVLHVMNKSDRPAEWEISRVPAIPTAALTGQGIEQLIEEIRRRLGCVDVSMVRPRCWTSRQRAIVQRALADPRALDSLTAPA